MNKELVIHSTTDEVVIALLEEKKLVELHKEKTDNDFAVGDLYLGRVKKIVPSLNAAFVDVGYTKDAFLHYLDLGPQLKSFKKFTKGVQSGKFTTSTLNKFEKEEDIKKDGKIDEVISSNQNILIQVAKEPISTKGPRVSCEISLAGRFLVLVPFSDKVTCSQKIRNREERNRLKTLIRSIKPKNFGVIIRTVAQNKKVAELDTDLRDLAGKWEKLFGNLKKAKQNDRVLGEINRSNALIRDLLNPSFNNIHVENEELHDEIKSYLTSIAPDRLDILKHFKSRLPIFEHFGIERQIKTSFGKTVSMSKGAYLVIEHTEALHVIDVNSGNRSNKAGSQEDTALEVNLISATEVARQLQLRDMGGIIVVDFIDMHKVENRNKLFQHLKEQMAFDRTKHKILPPSKFGLVQITRQRVRPELSIKTTEANPNKNGEVEAPIVLLDKIEADLEKFISNPKNKKIQLHVHPSIAAYLLKGVNSIRFKWYLKHKKWITIIPRDAYTYLHYRFKSPRD